MVFKTIKTKVSILYKYFSKRSITYFLRQSNFCLRFSFKNLFYYPHTFFKSQFIHDNHPIGRLLTGTKNVIAHLSFKTVNFKKSRLFLKVTWMMQKSKRSRRNGGG